VKRILVADDEPYVRRILRLTLEGRGYEVVSVSNGEEALESINENTPDVLITDIVMPRMNGKKLCRAVEQNHPERKFLIMVMTSRTERDERRWVNEMTNIEFLEKPLSPRQLIARLEEYFQIGVSSETSTREEE
jgi:DNA-binding response OmpR family regulator